MKKKSITKKLEDAAKKYDAFLESARNKDVQVRKAFRKFKKIVVPRIKETKKVFLEAAKPTTNYLNRTRTNIQEGFSTAQVSGRTNIAPLRVSRKASDRDVWARGVTSGNINLKPVPLPKPINDRDIWDRSVMSGRTGLKPTPQPQPFESRDVWSGRKTVGLKKSRLPKLF